MPVAHQPRSRRLLPIDYRPRLNALRRGMKQLRLPSLVVSRAADVQYLCGFTGSNAILGVTAGRAVLFVDGRFIAQAREEAKGARVVIAKNQVARAAAEWLASIGVAGCGFDPASVTVAELDHLRKLYRDAAGKPEPRFLRPLRRALVSELRVVKDEAEIERIELAARMGAELFRAVAPLLRAGRKETEIAGRLESEARARGAEGMSFETIVASGRRSSQPHGKATTGVLPRRGFVTLDFGVILNNYCSDMTRTVFIGKASSRERSVYEAVLEAKRSAVAAVKPGAACGEIDEAARRVLRRAGFEKYFTHSTGHGVGLEIHEEPRIAAWEKRVLRAGMVITIEPGVYFPGEFGVRIEDMAVVTEDGARVLTPARDDWTDF